MLGRNGILLAACVALTSLAGCGGGGGGGASDPGAVAAQYEGAIASNDVARGEEMYNGVCMSCHAGGAPSLNGIAWTAARMRQQIREGEGQMPAIGESRLSASDLEAILAYMVTIGAVQADAGAEPAADTTGGESDTEG